MMYLFSEASFGEHGQYQILAWVNSVDANVCWGPGLRYRPCAVKCLYRRLKSCHCKKCQFWVGPGLALLMVHVCSCTPAYRMEIGQALFSRSGLTLISGNVAWIATQSGFLLERLSVKSVNKDTGQLEAFRKGLVHISVSRWRAMLLMDLAISGSMVTFGKKS